MSISLSSVSEAVAGLEQRAANKSSFTKWQEKMRMSD